MNLYGRFTIVFLVLSSVSYITSEHILKWDIGWQFCFLSYFLMGYKLRKWSENRKNNLLAFVLILSGFTVNTGLGFINYLRGLNGLPVDVIPFKENPFSYAPLAPIEVIASCLIFAGFSVLRISKGFSKISGYTFLIYLIHAGVWDVLFQIIGNRPFGNPAIETGVVVASSIAVFTISLLAAMIYKKIQHIKYI